MASKQFYKRLLQNDLKKTLKLQQEEYEAQQAQAKKEGAWGSIGGTLGGLIGQFGAPALALALAPMTGGTSLLAMSALGAAAGSYLGSKVGAEVAPGELSSGDITGGDSDLGKGSLGEYKKSVNRLGASLETDRQTSALKTGATAAATGITMGADKYANYVKNPYRYYFPKEDAAGMTSSIVEGKDKYSILDIVQQTGTTGGTSGAAYIPDATKELAARQSVTELDDLLAAGAYKDPSINYSELAAQQSKDEMALYEQTKYRPAAIDDDPIHTNLLQAVRNPYIRYE